MKTDNVNWNTDAYLYCRFLYEVRHGYNDRIYLGYWSVNGQFFFLLYPSKGILICLQARVQFRIVCSWTTFWMSNFEVMVHRIGCKRWVGLLACSERLLWAWPVLCQPAVLYSRELKPNGIIYHHYLPSLQTGLYIWFLSPPQPPSHTTSSSSCLVVEWNCECVRILNIFVEGGMSQVFISDCTCWAVIGALPPWCLHLPSGVANLSLTPSPLLITLHGQGRRSLFWNFTPPLK